MRSTKQKKGSTPSDPASSQAPSGLGTPPAQGSSGTVEVSPSNAPGRMLVRQLRLRCIAGQDAGKVYSAEGARVVMGTDESADLRLRDRTVSRFHCEISLVDGQAVLRDPGSRNGTLVDGVPVFHAPLRDGSILTIGHTQLRLEFGAEPITIALSERERFGTMVGRAPSMRALFARLERVAPTDATVLIEGETGTGKEAVAESIHRESARHKGPLIVVDCGAVPHDLLESELFGHEKGSFTGATNRRDGALEAASGGTVFLDEIGELSHDLQPKLLRALERREIKRVGSNEYLPIDVRVVAATNRNLRVEVNARRFRADLFYRLAVVQVSLPPLRERAEDLPLLVDHILQSLGASQHPEAPTLRTAEFMSELARHAWPGNVRELRNYVERCLALRERVPLGPEGVMADTEEAGVPISANLPLREAREVWTRYCERRYLMEILRAAENNVTAAARAAGVDRIHFYRLLWRHGLR